MRLEGVKSLSARTSSTGLEKEDPSACVSVASKEGERPKLRRRAVANENEFVFIDF
jgi:hypothetical protein